MDLAYKRIVCVNIQRNNLRRVNAIEYISSEIARDCVVVKLNRMTLRQFYLSRFIDTLESFKHAEFYILSEDSSDHLTIEISAEMENRR